MSPFHSFMNRASLFWLLGSGAAVFSMQTLALQSRSLAGPLSREAMNTVTARLSKGLGIDQFGGIVSGLEGTVNSGSEEEKLQAMQQAIKLAEVILSQVDRTVPASGTVLRTPNLDRLGPEGARIFPGSDPEAIHDPTLRAAYVKLIKENDALLIRVGVEIEKYESAENALRVAARIMAKSKNREVSLASIMQYIETLECESWIKDRLRIATTPNYVVASRPDGSADPVVSQRPQAGEPPASVDETTNVKQGAAIEGDSAPSFSVDHSRFKSLWTWLAACAISIFTAWKLLKRRS